MRIRVKMGSRSRIICFVLALQYSGAQQGTWHQWEFKLQARHVMWHFRMNDSEIPMDQQQQKHLLVPGARTTKWHTGRHERNSSLRNKKKLQNFVSRFVPGCNLRRRKAIKNFMIDSSLFLSMNWNTGRMSSILRHEITFRHFGQDMRGWWLWNGTLKNLLESSSRLIKRMGRQLGNK